jgi:DNA polymerase-3 subunit delta
VVIGEAHYDAFMARRAATKSNTVIDAKTRLLVLHGVEQALKDEAIAALHDAVEADHGAVDVLRFDGKDARLADVLDELRSFGLMQQHKIVIVADADQFVTNHRAVLERYAQDPVDHGTLVLNCGRWYKGKLDKMIAKVGALVECKPLTPAKVKSMLIERAASRYQRQLTGPAAEMLIDRLGVSLLRLENEVAKLAVLVEDGGAILPELIDQVVGRSSDEQAWAVQEAVLAAMADPRSGGGAAIAKIHELIDLSRQADVLVAYFVADLIRKLYLAMMMSRQGVSDRQIASELRLWGPRQTMFMAALRRLSEPAAGRLFDRIVQCDARAKSGFGDSTRNIECFCAAMVDQLN